MVRAMDSILDPKTPTFRSFMNSGRLKVKGGRGHRRKGLRG